jgi:hypothetical protein
MSEKDIIEQLTKEIDVLKLELVRLHRMLQQEADSSTKHIQELYKRVTCLRLKVSQLEQAVGHGGIA